ncbi:hypothetical protein B9Z55_017834 [Caenorhabditis nigoni]|uniref:MULE transposase domain-containing protein n=1 Tax=Caenorhabditis nigoni TaxID=1611254 RepID=A0A2G5TBF9_9PELO|nr:hypothetical protein B9Z55_017834 [Caenorhabditis nigoni]
MAPRKNKPIIQVKGFAMRLQKKNQNGTELYYCVERERRARCDAAYVLDKTNNTFLMRKPHTRHDEDYAYLVRQALKKNANNGKPREVIDDVRDQFSTVASVACGSYDAKRKMIALAKGRKEEDVVEMDKGGSIANVFALTKVKDEKIGSGTGSSRILVFASDTGIELLANSETVFCDGTFDCVPAPFAQLFTIHAYVSPNVVRPVVFSLLSDKQTSTYETVLKIVLASHPSLSQWEPKTVICDFETALKNAFESQFPRSNVQGCLFHLVQCWRRKAEKLKCYDEFIKGTIQDFWVRIKSIPFIVPTETKQYFDLIVSTVPTPISANVQTFIDYLVDYYIDDTVRFPPKMWSCAERTLTRIHRTTNVVESWHKVLTCVHSQKNGISPVLLSDILVKLKAEEMHTKKDWEELKLNPNFQVNRNRKLTNALKDARLIKTLENLPIPPNMPLTGLNLLDAISDAHSV